MTTKQIMIDRIADELGQRTDLESSISAAITSAVDAYRNQGFWFQTKRGVCTFSTVAGQEDYTSAANANIPLLIKPDFARITISSDTFRLKGPIQQEEMEGKQGAYVTSDVSREWSFYDQTVWLWPSPAAVYSVRIAGVFSVAAPATADEAGNAWMLYAERLIRARAKVELGLHVLYDQTIAQGAAEGIRDALAQLQEETAMKQRVGKGEVEAVSF